MADACVVTPQISSTISHVEIAACCPSPPETNNWTTTVHDIIKINQLNTFKKTYRTKSDRFRDLVWNKTDDCICNIFTYHSVRLKIAQWVLYKCVLYVSAVWLRSWRCFQILIPFFGRVIKWPEIKACRVDMSRFVSFPLPGNEDSVATFLIFDVSKWFWYEWAEDYHFACFWCFCYYDRWVLVPIRS